MALGEGVLVVVGEAVGEVVGVLVSDGGITVGVDAAVGGGEEAGAVSVGDTDVPVEDAESSSAPQAELTRAARTMKCINTHLRILQSYPRMCNDGSMGDQRGACKICRMILGVLVRGIVDETTNPRCDIPVFPTKV